jgi:dihydrodipicolinate synthase/N-acetylneuraminate lyase
MIYGIGLPRTGTQSLAQALNKYNLTGEHYCLLDGSLIHFAAGRKEDFTVDNCFYNCYKVLYKNDSEAKFILTTRDKEEWLESLSKFKPVDLPDIIKYRVEVKEFFEQEGGSLFILDINSKHKWEQLSAFLNLPIPEEVFPGDLSWRIDSPVFPIVPAYDRAQEMNGVSSYIEFLQDEAVEIIMTTAGTTQFNLLCNEEVCTLNCSCNTLFEKKKIMGLKAEGFVKEEIKLYNAKDFKNTALMFMYPERYYSDETIVEYFHELADLSNYPVFIHCLSFKHGRGGTYCYTAELINKICKHKNIVGIKEETPDLMQAYNICRNINKDNCEIIVAGGSQRRYRLLGDAGAQSFLAGIGSIYPEEDIAFLNSCVTGYPLNSKAEGKLFDVFFRIGWHPSLRYALKKKGLISEYDRMPFYQLTENEKREIDTVLEAIEKTI